MTRTPLSDADASPHHGDGRHPTTVRHVLVFVILLLVVVSVVPWRSQTFYTGGLDPIVIAKAALAAIALSVAALLVLETRVHVPVGLGPAAAIGIALLVSLLGALVAGNAPATFVLVARVFIVIATVVLVLTCVPALHALAALMASMSVVAVVAAATGLPSLAATGRLAGGLPEIHPNELAGLAAIPLLALVSVVLRQGVRTWPVVGIVVLAGIAVATGSRTALAGIAVAFVVALGVNGVRHRSVLYGLLVTAPLAYAVATFTGTLGAVATRSGSTDETSALDSRFTAWQVVLNWEWTSWERWLGLGLSVKEIRVDQQWRDFQVLDSSWASLLAQCGLIGALLIGGLLAWCVLTAAMSARRRWIILPLLTLLLIRTTTESGLVDSAMPFVVLLTLATVLTHRSRHADEGFRSAGDPLVPRRFTAQVVS